MSVQEQRVSQSIAERRLNEERQRIESQQQGDGSGEKPNRRVSIWYLQGGDYGGALMWSVEERNQYREQLRLIESDQERLQFMAKHREEMQGLRKNEGH